MAFLRDIFDISIPGQRINAAREQRAQRAAAEEDRARQAEAFKAIQSGDVLGAAAYDPAVAGQYQQVAAGEDERSAAKDTLMRQAGLRAVQAAKALASKLGDPLAAFDSVAKRSGSLFGSEEELAQARQFVADNGAAGFDAIEQAFGTQAKPGQRYYSTAGGLYDTETGQVIPGTGKAEDPLLGERAALLRAQTAAAQAKASSTSDKPKAQGEAIKALDRAVAKDVAEWIGGGSAGVAANLARLDGAIETLRSGDNISGKAIGQLPVWARSTVAPQSAAVQQEIESAIQSSLKQTLGAQFARVEGEQLLARAFDPRQSEAENARRAGLVAQMTRELAVAKQAQAEYILENGSIAGYEGPDFDKTVDKLVTTLRSFSGKGTSVKAPKQSDDPELDALLEKY